jgi:hypothetical protein
MTATTIGDGFDIGRVAKHTFGAIQANIWSFVLLAVLFVALPQLLQGWLQGEIAPGDIGRSAMAGLASLPVALLTLVTATIAQAAVNYGTFAYLSGKPASFAECLNIGWRRWWRLLLVLILNGLGVGLATLLFIVPGLMLAMRWSVAAPVQVIEGGGLRASLGRSAELTKGRRWAIFGLWMVLGVTYLLLLLTVLALANGGSLALVGLTASPIARILVLPIITPIANVVTAAGLAAVYYELRGGAGTEGVAAVFD